jgi:hypothetical protein
MLEFVAAMERELGFICRELDIGGGLGVDTLRASLS